MKKDTERDYRLDFCRGLALILIFIDHVPGNPASHWTLRSWDRTQIPKPFSTVALAVGEPFEVPRTLADQDLEYARQELERRLHVLEERALDVGRQGQTFEDLAQRLVQERVQQGQEPDREELVLVELAVEGTQ